MVTTRGVWAVKTNTICQLLLILTLLIFVNPSRAEYLIDGAQLVQLTKDGKSKAVAWAYHGDLIAFVREISDTSGQLMIMKSDGTGEVAVSPIGNPFYAEWSWKGDKIAYEFSNAAQRESQGGIFVYDIKREKTTAVSSPYPRYYMNAVDGLFWSADDQHVAYGVEVGPAETDQVWVANAASGKMWQLLPERGRVKDQQWSPTDPKKLAVLVQSSGEGFDLATVDLDGRNVAMLTDIDAQSVYTDRPRWSVDGEKLAWKFDLDMTRTEREIHVEDCFIANYDGTGSKNLTKATTASTEDMLDLRTLFWTWDNKWVISPGTRYDQQGNRISTLYKIDPVNGGYEILLTSDPRRTGKTDYYRTFEPSYDGTKIAFAATRLTVRSWGPDAEYENPILVLGIYDMVEGKAYDLLSFDEQLDRREIQAYKEMRAEISEPRIQDISWSPDNRSILLTIATIISDEDDVTDPDIYRLDLPERFIDSSASKHIGPPIGRANGGTVQTTSAVAVDASTDTVLDERMLTPSNLEIFVTEVVQPQHMTVNEAVESLSPEYGDYFTVNTSRNIILFKGPQLILDELKNDLKLIDSLPTHILVDLLAVELSDEANRNLGLDWSYAEGHFGLVQPAGSTIRDFGPNAPWLGDMAILPGIGQAFYQGVGTLPREFFVRLSTLVKDGQGTILANPRTVATSGVESLINIRKTLNYFFNEGFDVAGRPVIKKSDISSDTIGRITPTLLPDGRIHLVADVKVGTFTFTQNAGLPELTTRESQTEVTVEQGQTIVIGGLRQQEKSETITKVPFLGDLPLLGFLFKNEKTETRHSVLTIFISPQVMNSDNLKPDWPLLDPAEHKIIPIMPDEPDEEY